MIQFNLLPDLKIQYIKAKRARRNVVMVAIIVTLSTGGIFLLMLLSANVFQPIHMNNLNDDIKTYSEEIRNIPDLDKVLTVQNQLNSINNLHESKPETSRLFNYISKLTPNNVTISNLKIDLTTNTITITGNSDSLASVNKFVDTLKFTDYIISDPSTKKVFSNVVMVQFSKSQNEKVSYTISAQYDPEIFNTRNLITLIVPNTTTTRSTTEKPTELFKPNDINQ